MPWAGEGGKGKRGQGQPERPQTDLSRHELHSQHPAPATTQRGSRICPSSPSNTSVHLSLLLPWDQPLSPARAPLGGHLHHPQTGHYLLLTPGTRRYLLLTPGMSPLRQRLHPPSIRFLRRSCVVPQGWGRWHFPPRWGHPSARPPTCPAATAPQGAAHGDGYRKSQNPRVGETPMTARPFAAQGGMKLPVFTLQERGEVNVPLLGRGKGAGEGPSKTPRKCWGLTQPRQSSAAATPCQGKLSHGADSWSTVQG